MIPNRLGEPDAMAPTAPSETIKEALKDVFVHNSAQRAFQEVSSEDSETSHQALRDGAYGADTAPPQHIEHYDLRFWLCTSLAQGEAATHDVNT